MGALRLAYRENPAPLKVVHNALKTCEKGCAEGYRYGFQGQEMDDEIKGTGNSLDFSNRIYDSRLGRFLSIDPITADFPFVTPYNFAENRVIDGIDLWGLQYLRADEARINITGGGVMLKRENLSNPTNYRIRNAGMRSYYDNNGQLTYGTNFPQVLSEFPIALPTQPGEVRRQYSSSRPGGGSASERRQYRRTVQRDGGRPGGNRGIGQPGPGTGRPGGGAAYIVGLGLDTYANYLVGNDMKIARQQEDKYAPRVLEILDRAIETGGIIPDHYTFSQIGDIGNYILQGQFTGEYDLETFNEMREISQGLMINYDVPLNCEQCQDRP